MNPLLTSVATEVAVEFGSKLSAILGPTRGLPADSRSRAIAMYVYRQTAPGPVICLSELGRLFNRDRTTVRHALGRVYWWIVDEKDFARRIEDVVERVKARGHT